MRILMVHPGPEFSVHDVFNGWYKALTSLGHQVMVFNTNHRLMLFGNSHVKDYPKDWVGTRELPGCPSCGQPPFKKALSDDQVKLLTCREIFQDAYAFWPDIIFFVSGFFFDDATMQILRKRGHKLVILHTESPYEDERQMKIGQNVHLNLVNDPTNLEDWESVGPAFYMPHAYDPQVHYPVLPAERKRYQLDFSFIGTGFKSRRDFFSKLDLWGLKREGLRISIGGGGWGDAIGEAENEHLLDFLGHHPEQCVDNDETANVYRMTKVGINLYRQEGEAGKTGMTGWSMGPREVELAATQSFFIRDPRPEGDELFKGILPTFSGPSEARELIRWWATPKRDILREDLARRAREKITDRTFENNARRFMELLDDSGLTV